MEKAAKSESRTSIILVIRNVEKNDTSLDGLFGSLTKSKSDLECILVDATSGDAIHTKINADKSFNELAGKGRAKLLKGDAKDSTGALYAAALREATGAICLVIEDMSTVNTGNLVSWLTSNRKNIVNNEIYVGSNNLKASINKSKGSGKWISKVYNSAIRFFTPLDLSDNVSGVLAMRTESGSALFEGKLAVAQNHLEILHLAACDGIRLKEFAINTDKMPVAKSIGSIFTVPFTAFKLRWRYFITGSLHEMKLPEKPSLINGNHPVYRFAFFVMVLLASFLMPYLSKDFGMTWDEKQHNDYSVLAHNWFTSFGSDTAAIAESTSNADFIRQCYRYYGEQCNLISAFIYMTFDLPPFETRHFMISLYGLLGLIFIGLSAKELGGWRAGVIALLFTFFNPGWLGNSMNNPTDIPFAAGFAVSLYFIIKILKALPVPKFSHLVWLAIGIGIAVGSRVGGFLILAYFAMFLGIDWLSRLKKQGASATKLIWPYAKMFLLLAVLGYILGVILWPYGLTDIFRNPYKSFVMASTNTSFYNNNIEIFEGHRMYMQQFAPWYYVIKFLSMGNPLYLLLGLFLPLALVKWLKQKPGIGLLLVLVFMTVFPVAYAEYSNLNYYNGWRHYLFVLPSWITLAAISFDFLIGSANKIVRYATLVVLTVLFVKPAYWIIKNHPNEYVYFNETVGGLKGAYGLYETDYYSNSCRAAAEWIARQEPNKKLKVGINNEPLTGSYYAHKINDSLEFVWVREYEEQKTNWDYLILTTRTFSRNELQNGSFPPKGTVFTVEADGIPLAAVVKREDWNMLLGYRALDAQQPDSAIYYFENATRYAPKDEETWRMLGFTLINRGRLDSAELMLKKAIEIYPENFTAYSHLGLIYFNRKDFKKAIDAFTASVKFKENMTESWYYGALAYLNLGDYQNAITFLEKSIKHNAGIPEVYYYLAKAYNAVGQTQKAADNYQLAVSVKPDFAQAWLELAGVFTKLNQKDYANQCMEKYRALGGQ